MRSANTIRLYSTRSRAASLKVCQVMLQMRAIRVRLVFAAVGAIHESPLPLRAITVGLALARERLPVELLAHRLALLHFLHEVVFERQSYRSYRNHFHFFPDRDFKDPFHLGFVLDAQAYAFAGAHGRNAR